MSELTRITNPVLKKLWGYIKGDRYIIYAIVFLTVVSFLAVYSASSVLAYQKMGGNTTFYPLRHLTMLIGGFVIMAATSNVHPKYFAGLAELMLGVGVLMLIATMIIGSSVNGSSRWLDLGFVSFQPSEFAKISLIIFVAKMLAKHEKHPDDAFLPCIMATAIVCGIIMFENLSTCLLIAMSVVSLLFIGRISMSKLAAIGLLAAICVSLLIVFADQVHPVFPRAKTWRARIERFTQDKSPENDKADNDYQAQQALAAVSISGILGSGPGNSYMKNFLPMAFSDFIFSIILEEYGLWGCLLILIAYITILARARIMAGNSNVPFHIYTITGLAILLSLQALINMMVGVGLMPVTGQTLPMISMGGTSNFITGFAYGIILSISNHTIMRMKTSKN